MRSLFGSPKVVIGMVHVKAMPGFPGSSGNMNTIIKHALDDALALERGGVDGLIVENIFNRPRQKIVGPETVAPLTLVMKEIVDAVKVPVGIKVLFNDVKAELAIAHCTGAHFVRVSVYTDAVVAMAGIIEGCAYEAVTYRRMIGADRVKILADVHIKHAAPLAYRAIEHAAFDAATSGMADGLVITGERTGLAADVDDVIAVKKAVPDKLLLVGSGTNLENVTGILKHADGAIVGTYFKVDGIIENPVDESRVRRFIDTVRGAS
jgi:membrane complex biogenesis BtpA family protein